MSSVAGNNARCPWDETHWQTGVESHNFGQPDVSRSGPLLIIKEVCPPSMYIDDHKLSSSLTCLSFGLRHIDPSLGHVKARIDVSYASYEPREGTYKFRIMLL
jgi:hypothetical protein